MDGTVPSGEATLGIGALSGRTGVRPSALRYYEAEGLIAAERNASGQRRYHRDVLRRLQSCRLANPGRPGRRGRPGPALPTGVPPADPASQSASAP
jgi:hypothetical protein